MNTVFIRRSSGVSSGKLAAHSVPESCFWKSLRLVSVKSTGFFSGSERDASALEISKPTACAQTLYLPAFNGGNKYRPDSSVYTVVVTVSVMPRAETPTPSRGLPSEDFTVPDKVLAVGAVWEKPPCAQEKNTSDTKPEKIMETVLLLCTKRLRPSRKKSTTSSRKRLNRPLLLAQARIGIPAYPDRPSI